MLKEALIEMVILGLVMPKESKILGTKVILNKLPETRQKDRTERGFIRQEIDFYAMQFQHIIKKNIHVARMLPVKWQKLSHRKRL